MALRQSRLAARLSAFVSGTSANFATMSALTAPLAIVLAAFAVDEASLYVERREAQAITDLAAIAAASDIARAEHAASATLADNGLMEGGRTNRGGGQPAAGGSESLSVVPGRYTADPALKANERFVADESPHNAVRVSFAKTGRRYFSKSFFAPPRISTSAIAGTSDQAAFSIGSRLLRLEGAC